MQAHHEQGSLAWVRSKRGVYRGTYPYWTFVTPPPPPPVHRLADFLCSIRLVSAPQVATLHQGLCPNGANAPDFSGALLVRRPTVFVRRLTFSAKTRRRMGEVRQYTEDANTTGRRGKFARCTTIFRRRATNILRYKYK